MNLNSVHSKELFHLGRNILQHNHQYSLHLPLYHMSEGMLDHTVDKPFLLDTQ